MANFGDSYPDLDTLVFQALRRDLAPSITVGSELDVFTVDHLPYVMFNTTGSGASQNRLGVWPFMLTIWAFGMSAKESFDTAEAVYQVLRSWSQSVRVDGIGGLRYEAPNAMFHGTGGEEKAMIGKPIRQTIGSFMLTAFEAPYFEK